jgi:hypothetical protein
MKKELLKKNLKAYRAYLRWVSRAIYTYNGLNEMGMHVMTRDRIHF